MSGSVLDYSDAKIPQWRIPGKCLNITGFGFIVR